MTPSQLAKQVGCSPSTVKEWIRKRKLAAKAVTKESGQIVYDISTKSARDFLAKPKSTRGWPRGKHRVPKT